MWQGKTYLFCRRTPLKPESGISGMWFWNNSCRWHKKNINKYGNIVSGPRRSLLGILIVNQTSLLSHTGIPVFFRFSIPEILLIYFLGGPFSTFSYLQEYNGIRKEIRDLALKSLYNSFYVINREGKQQQQKE